MVSFLSDAPHLSISISLACLEPGRLVCKSPGVTNEYKVCQKNGAWLARQHCAGKECVYFPQTFSCSLMLSCRDPESAPSKQMAPGGRWRSVRLPSLSSRMGYLLSPLGPFHGTHDDYSEFDRVRIRHESFTPRIVLPSTPNIHSVRGDTSLI